MIKLDVETELQLTIEILPCPCCGHADLDVGQQSFNTYGVLCNHCGLEMHRTIPDYYDADIMKISYKEFTLRLAIMAWNRREETTL